MKSIEETNVKLIRKASKLHSATYNYDIRGLENESYNLLKCPFPLIFCEGKISPRISRNKAAWIASEYRRILKDSLSEEPMFDNDDF